MNREELYDGISDIREDLIEEADRHKLKKTKPVWKRIASLAAAAALIVGVGAAGFWAMFGPMGSNSGGSGDSHAPEDAVSYMDYAGPVFPLASLSGSAGITASRNVDYDFTQYSDESYRSWVTVTDSYVLTNTTGADITLELSYPFAGSLSDSTAFLPVITAGGEAVETDLHVGPYSGGFEGVWGSDEEGTYNLDYIESWEGYRVLLESGTYRELAYSGNFTLDIPVTVYKVDNYQILDTDRPPEAMYILLVGDDLAEYTLQGYSDGGCDKGEEMDITADVTRYETTLDAFLREQVEFTPQPDSEDATIADCLTREEYFSCIADMFWSYSQLGQTPMDRYDFGMLEDYTYGAPTMSRVMYVSFTATIPAGESLEISAAMRKDASFDYYGHGRGSTDCHGYDLVTQLGTDLTFSEQTASLRNTDSITILSQNFGFDLEKGITKVTLDPEVPHYWLEITQKPAETDS